MCDAVGRRDGEFDVGVGEQAVVGGRMRAPLHIPLVEKAQLDAQDRRLNLVHARVEAELLVVVALFRAVVAKQAQPARQLGIGGGDRTALAVGAQILGEVEAEAAEVPDGSGAAAPVFSAVRLGGVLDDDQVMPRGDLHDRVHIGHLAVQVHGQDGSGARGDPRLDLADVHQIGARIDIDEDRRRADHDDRFGSGEEGVRNRDDLIARTDPGRPQGQMQRVRPVGDGDAVSDVAVRGELVFEGQRVRPQKEVHLVEDLLDRLPSPRV